LEGSPRRELERIGEGWLHELHAGRRQVGKERRSETELRQMMLAAARKHEECSELEDLFIFGPTPRLEAIGALGSPAEVATFKKLEGRPNWNMEWITDDRLAKAAFERVVRSVQTQIELE
jgi:hypothetical protein